MNKLPFEKQAAVLSLLSEGNSIRSTERITGVHRDTIMRLTVAAGEKAYVIMDSRMRNLHSKFIQMDEVWCFVGKKQKQAVTKQDQELGYGDQWIFIAMDAESKLVPIVIVGDRSLQNADRMMSELKDRIPTRFQLSTDAFAPYRLSAYKYLGGDVDYGQVIKSYGKNDRNTDARYSPAQMVHITIRPVMGNPNMMEISTSYIERQNLSLRMECRRFTRLTNAFSKKVENLRAAVYLHFYHYNFMRIHSTLRMTPAMKAGITRSIWKWQDLLDEDRTWRIAA